MPCNTDGWSVPSEPDLTPLLCSACRILERQKYDFDENPALSKWWDAHKKQDAAEQEAEKKQLKRKAKAKILTHRAVGDLTQADINLLKEFGYL